MENLITILAFVLLWLPFFMFLALFVVYLIIYMFKSSDYKTEKLKALSEEERNTYEKVRIEIEMPFFSMLQRKEVKKDENK